VPWLLVKGQWKMLADFAMVIRVVSIPKTWQNKQLPNVPLSHNNHKKNLERNVALTSFVGRMVIVVARRLDGCS
jgi:hypothetical protein